MAAIELELIERGRSPESEVLSVEPGAEFRVIWMGGPDPLRRVALRGDVPRARTGEEEETVLWLEAPPSAGEPFKVLQVGRTPGGDLRYVAGPSLELPVEKDGSLSAQVELRLVAGETIKLVLRQVGKAYAELGRAADSSRFEDAFGGGGGKGIRGFGAAWAVPSAWTTMGNPIARLVFIPLMKLARKLKIPLPLLGLIIMTIAFFGVAGWAVANRRRARRAGEEAAEAQEQLVAAQNAARGAVGDAANCAEEVATLQRTLLSPEEAMRQDVVVAIDMPLARTSTTSGFPPGEELTAALSRDELLRPELVGWITAVREQSGLNDEQRDWVGNRLGRAAALEEKVPSHVLAWHPRRSGWEQGDSFEDWNRGTPRATLKGPWGLSERVASEFGRLEPGQEIGDRRGADGADPRFRPGWSVNTLRDAVVAARNGLLGAEDLGGRLAAPPDQVHLWSLTLLHAYNELPAGNGAAGLDDCISQLVQGAVASQTAEPGEAILPPIDELLGNERFGRSLRRTAACPWREDDIIAGARAAVLSVAETALFEGQARAAASE